MNCLVKIFLTYMIMFAKLLRARQLGAFKAFDAPSLRNPPSTDLLSFQGWGLKQ